MQIAALLLLALWRFPHDLRAQDRHLRTMGDSAVAPHIDSLVRDIATGAEGWRFALAPEDVLRLDSGFALEIRAAPRAGPPARIVASAWTAAGKYSVEFFLRDGSPLFAFETFEYYEHQAPPGAWRNFKGIPAWERRTYLREHRVVYARSVGAGAPAPGDDTATLLRRVRGAVAILSPP